MSTIKIWCHKVSLLNYSQFSNWNSNSILRIQSKVRALIDYFEVQNLNWKHFVSHKNYGKTHKNFTILMKITNSGMLFPAQQFAIEILKMYKHFNKIQKLWENAWNTCNTTLSKFHRSFSTDSIVLGTNFAKWISTIASSDNFNIDIIFVMRQKWHQFICQFPLDSKKKNKQSDRRQLINFYSVNRSEFSKILSFFLKRFFLFSEYFKRCSCQKYLEKTANDFVFAK